MKEMNGTVTKIKMEGSGKSTCNCCVTLKMSQLKKNERLEGKNGANLRPCCWEKCGWRGRKQRVDPSAKISIPLVGHCGSAEAITQ